MIEPERILILTAYYHPFLGGVETHARRLAIFLRDAGLEVTVLTRQTEIPGDRCRQLDGIAVHRVPPAGPRTMLRKWGMIGPAFLSMLRRAHEFDLVYCAGYQGVGLAGMLAGRLLGKPVVVVSGNLGVLSGRYLDPQFRQIGLAADGLAARLLRWPLRRLYRMADGYACIASTMEQEAIDEGIAPERVHSLPNAVSLDRFRPAGAGEKERIRARERWPVDRPLVLYAGRLSQEKGIQDLIAAWQRLPRQRASLAVVGPDMTGHRMDVGCQVRRRVAEAGLEDEVRFAGARDDVPELLRAADLFVQPSHYEAFGISVIEAMASGLPVVASAVGGMLDYLIDGENALLCPPSAPERLAEAIERLLDEPGLGATLAAAGRRTVESRFSESQVFGRYVDLFRRLVAESR